MTGIFSGLNVVEMGSASVAASLTGMVLADAGARVLKIEAPEGDGLRRINPSGFLVWNRGKESVVVDLRTPGGQRGLRDLAAAADVVIDAFAPGTTAAWESARRRSARSTRPWSTAASPASGAPGRTLG